MRPWLAVLLVVTLLGVVGAVLGVRHVSVEMSKPLDDPPVRPFSLRPFGNGPIQT